MMQILQVFYSIFSGIITALGIQNELIPMGSPFLGLIALVPLYIALSNSKSFKQAGILTGIQMMTTHLISSYWLGYFEGFAVFTLGASTVAYFFFGLVFGRFLFIPFVYTGKTNSSYTFYNSSKQRQLEELNGRHIWATSIRVFGFSVIWTLFEYFKSIGFLAYPWGTLSMTAYKWNFLTQIADTTGVYGITFIFAAFAAIVAEGILLLPTDSFKLKKEIKPYAFNALFCLSLLVISTFYGFIQYIIPRHQVKTMQTVLIQQNTDPWTDGHTLGILKSQNLTKKAIAESEEPVDLIVWSESALGSVLPKGIPLYERRPKESPFIPFLKELGIPLIAGAPVSEDDNTDELYNAAVLFDKKANYVDFYAKSHLVPFAEYIPFSNTKFVQTVMSTLVGFSKGWKPGERIVLFPIVNQKGETTNVSAPICFEDAFADACRALHNAGSEVFINITNDSWSKTNSSEIQHFVVASYRAIENRTTLVRCTNSGYTTVINPIGKVLLEFPLFEDYSKSVTIPVYKHSKTLYSALGDWFPILLLIGCLCFAGIVVFYLRPRYYKNERIGVMMVEFPDVSQEDKLVLSDEMKQLIEEYVKVTVEKYLLQNQKIASKTKTTSKAMKATKPANTTKATSKATTNKAKPEAKATDKTKLADKVTKAKSSASSSKTKPAAKPANTTKATSKATESKAKPEAKTTDKTKLADKATKAKSSVSSNKAKLATKPTSTSKETSKAIESKAKPEAKTTDKTKLADKVTKAKSSENSSKTKPATKPANTTKATSKATESKAKPEAKNTNKTKLADKATKAKSSASSNKAKPVAKPASTSKAASKTTESKAKPEAKKTDKTKLADKVTKAKSSESSNKAKPAVKPASTTKATSKATESKAKPEAKTTDKTKLTDKVTKAKKE